MIFPDETIYSLLEITRLQEEDNEDTFETWLDKLILPQTKVAGLCTYGKFLPLLKQNKKTQNIALVCVANFPGGNQDPLAVIDDIFEYQEKGMQECDLVFPYPDLLKGNEKKAWADFEKILSAFPQLFFKIILEIAAFKDLAYLSGYAKTLQDFPVHFLKTSTGKLPQAANIEQIKTFISACQDKIGLKLAGGISDFKTANALLSLVLSLRGQEKIHPAFCRIGSSRLHEAISANGIDQIQKL